jgi:molecular chaperone GrpE (heat shock protein)
MDKNELRDSLDNFHKELEKSASLESGDRERLESMEADMRQMLEAEGAKRDDSLVEQLDQAVHQFEISHPELTIALGHLLDILSQEGI